MARPPQGTLRFTYAYIAAAVAATLAFGITNVLIVLSQGLGRSALTGLLPMMALYLVYSLGFTLVLGLVGWGLLRALRLHRAWWYALVGGSLGLAINVTRTRASQWHFTSSHWDLDTLYLYPCIAAGTAAGYSFFLAYYRHDQQDDVPQGAA